MYFRSASIVCGTMLVLMAVVPVMSDDILTKSDWQYLKSKGYTEESWGLLTTTAEECRYLHKLINDPKTSGKNKFDAITKFVFTFSMDKTITPGFKPSALGPCTN